MTKKIIMMMLEDAFARCDSLLGFGFCLFFISQILIHENGNI